MNPEQVATGRKLGDVVREKFTFEDMVDTFTDPYYLDNSIGYWVASYSAAHPDRYNSVNNPEVVMLRIVDEGDIEYHLTLAQLWDAFGYIIIDGAGLGYPLPYFRSFDMGDIDTDCGDAAIQVALFGEVIYG